MADVARSKADLLALFADNITGAISEQDLRDFVVSLLGEYGSLKTISGVTNQAQTATPVKMTGWTADGLSVGVTVAHANDEMTIVTDGVYRVEWDACFIGTNSKTYLLALYVDTGGGYADAGLPRIERKLGTGGDVGSAHMHGEVSLGAGDKIAIYSHSSDGGTAFTLKEGSFTAKRIG